MGHGTEFWHVGLQRLCKRCACWCRRHWRTTSFRCISYCRFLCVLLLFAIRFCEVADAESEARPSHWRTSIQELDRLCHEDHGGGRPFTFLCWLSDLLRSHSASCDDYTCGTGLHQEELGKGRLVSECLLGTSCLFMFAQADILN